MQSRPLFLATKSCRLDCPRFRRHLDLPPVARTGGSPARRIEVRCSHVETAQPSDISWSSRLRDPMRQPPCCGGRASPRAPAQGLLPQHQGLTDPKAGTPRARLPAFEKNAARSVSPRPGASRRRSPPLAVGRQGTCDPCFEGRRQWVSGQRHWRARPTGHQAVRWRPEPGLRSHLSRSVTRQHVAKARAIRDHGGMAVPVPSLARKEPSCGCRQPLSSKVSQRRFSPSADLLFDDGHLFGSPSWPCQRWCCNDLRGADRAGQEPPGRSSRSGSESWVGSRALARLSR